MGDYGIKVSRAGKEVTSSDLRDLLMHSNYAMFKYHLETTSTMTISAGDTSKTITIPHGLPYVPAFIVYSGDGTYNTMLPNRRSGYDGEDEHIFATADSTNIYIKWKSAIPYNTFAFEADGIYWEQTDGSSAFVVGNPGIGGKSSGWHFPDVTVAKNASLVSAYVEIRNVVSGPSTSNTKYKTYGIDEDDVGSIGDLGKAVTDAYHAREQSKISGYFNLGFDVTDEVNEIITRNNWASGNNMGFYVRDDSSPDNAYVGASTGSVSGHLTIVKTGTVAYSFRVLVFKDKIA